MGNCHLGTANNDALFFHLESQVYHTMIICRIFHCCVAVGLDWCLRHCITQTLFTVPRSEFTTPCGHRRHFTIVAISIRCCSSLDWRDLGFSRQIHLSSTWDDKLEKSRTVQIILAESGQERIIVYIMNKSLTFSSTPTYDSPYFVPGEVLRVVRTGRVVLESHSISRT